MGSRFDVGDGDDVFMKSLLASSLSSPSPFIISNPNIETNRELIPQIISIQDLCRRIHSIISAN